MSKFEGILPRKIGGIDIQTNKRNDQPQSSNTNENRAQSQDQDRPQDQQIQSQNKNKLLQCTNCDFVTRETNNFENHKRTHEMQLLACQECNYKTIYEKAFENHQRMHASFNHRCGICQRAFSSSENLKRHEFTDHAEFQQPARKACRFWLRGSCKFGENCKFLHIRQNACRFGSRCNRRQTCRFSHDYPPSSQYQHRNNYQKPGYFNGSYHNRNNYGRNNYDNNDNHHYNNDNVSPNPYHNQSNMHYDNYQQNQQNFHHQSRPNIIQMSHARGNNNQMRAPENNVDMMTPCPFGSRCDRKVYCPLTHPVPEVPLPRGQQGGGVTGGGDQPFLAQVWRGNPLQ